MNLVFSRSALPTSTADCIVVSVEPRVRLGRDARRYRERVGHPHALHELLSCVAFASTARLSRSLSYQACVDRAVPRHPRSRCVLSPEMREAPELRGPRTRFGSSIPRPVRFPLMTACYRTPPGHQKDMSHLRLAVLLFGEIGVNRISTKYGPLLPAAAQGLVRQSIFGLPKRARNPPRPAAVRQPTSR